MLARSIEVLAFDTAAIGTENKLLQAARAAIERGSYAYIAENNPAGRLNWLHYLATQAQSPILTWEIQAEEFLADTLIPTRERFEALINAAPGDSPCARFKYQQRIYDAGFSRYSDNLEIFFVSRIKALQQEALELNCAEAYTEMLILEARRFNLLSAHTKTDEALKRLDEHISNQTLSPELQLHVLHIKSQHLLDIGANAEAAEVYGQMIIVHRLVNDTTGWIGDLNNKGVAYYRMAEAGFVSHEASEPYFLEALRLAERTHHLAWIGITKGNLGLLYKDLDRCSEAIKYFEIDYALTSRTSDYGSGVNALLAMARCLIRLGQFDEAEERIRLAKELLQSKEPGNSIRLRAGAKLAEAEAELAEAKGDYAAALNAYRLFKTLSDSLDDSRNEASLREIRMAYDVDRIEHEKLLLEEQNRLNAEIITKQNTINRWSIMTIALMLVMVTVLLLAVRSSRKSRKHVQRLFQTTRRQNTKLSSFTYIVSHDLRSHATNIISLLKILTKDRPELLDETAYSMLERSAGNMARTIDDLHELLSSDDLNKSHNLRSVNVRDVIARTLENLQYSATEQNVSLKTTVPNELTIQTIPSFLESIVHNLVSNGIKYHSDEAESYVHIHAESSDGNCIITVTDNGLGIDLVDKAKALFQPYKTFHRHPDARGLGLFITRNQVESLGGSISVQSVPGAGSTFTVVLPLNPDYIFATAENA